MTSPAKTRRGVRRSRQLAAVLGPRLALGGCGPHTLDAAQLLFEGGLVIVGVDVARHLVCPGVVDGGHGRQVVQPQGRLVLDGVVLVIGG